MFDRFRRNKKPIRPVSNEPPNGSACGSVASLPPTDDSPVVDKSTNYNTPTNGQIRASAGTTPDKLPILAKLITDRLKSVVEHQARHLTNQNRELALQNEDGLKKQICAAAQQINDATLARIDDEAHAFKEVIDGHLSPLADRLEGALEKSTSARWSALAAQIQEVVSNSARQALLRPVIDGVLALLDRIGNERAFLTAWYRRDPELVLHLGARQMFERYDSAVQSFYTEIYMILRALDVHPLDCGAGRFNPHTQRIVEVEATKNPELDGHVARIFRAGFTWGDTVLRPEQVVVFKK